MIQHWKILSSYQYVDGWPWEKCTENLVQCMLKINRNVIKCEKHNPTTRSLIFLNFRKFWKNDNFEKNSKKMNKSWFWKRDGQNIMGWRGTLRVLRAETWLTVYRTIAIRKQWLSRADLGPHKMINQCNIFWSYQGFARWWIWTCQGFFVQNILKI